MRPCHGRGHRGDLVSILILPYIRMRPAAGAPMPVLIDYAAVSILILPYIRMRLCVVLVTRLQRAIDVSILILPYIRMRP
jgi:hypothetical protein